MTTPIESKLSDLQLKVYDLIRLAGWEGKTTDEVEVELTLTHQSASARVNELKNMKLIEERGARRKTRAGRGAFIYVLYGLTAADQRTKE
jgi:predicted transcriptional regulator